MPMTDEEWDRMNEKRMVFVRAEQRREELTGLLVTQVNHVGSTMRVYGWFSDFDELLPDYFNDVHRRVVAFFVMLAEERGIDMTTSFAADWLECVNDVGMLEVIDWERRLGIPAEQVRECVRVVFSLYPDLLERGFQLDSGSIDD